MATLAREKLGPLARRGAPPSRLGAPGKGRFLLIAGPFIAGAAVMGCGVWLRGWTFDYHGIANQTAFNHAAFAHMGGYTDIASLFFRNRMWLHRLPYVHYAFEYPVGTGLFAWLTSLVGAGVGTYLAVNAIVLGAFGLLTIWLLRRFEGANPWLLALSPALALYVVLNWDLVSIASLVVALVLFDRRRDAWGAVALGVATWTKFFPIIVLPVVLCARLLEGRDWRERARAWAWILIPFAAVTVAFNAPFIYRHGVHGGLVVSSSWFYFFHFNATRGAGARLRGLVLLRQQDVQPAIRPVGDGAAGADRRPGRLAVAFAATDLAFFVTAFSLLRLTGRSDAWFVNNVYPPSIAAREAALFAVTAWAAWAIIAGLKGPRPRFLQTDRRADPTGLPRPAPARTTTQSS
ncbi:MAG: hypothetical protein E6G05_12155 [Actinobacteria bacterium]|nr:MAG: hypothetical protein E6G05_12155 [Actinomycetota bacterium]